MSAPHALCVNRLSVQIAGAPLFSELTLDVAGETQVTLTGPSGSGKSTLLRCILGFRPWTSGTIYVQNEPLTAETVWRLRGLMAYVGQEPELGDGLVCDALRRPLLYRINRRLQFDREEARILFERLRLPDALLNKPITGLSGGEKQRVALVAAILLKRPILLLDEAASALDGVAKQAVRDFLRSLSGITILSVSHDTREFALAGPIFDMQHLSRETLP